MALQDSFRDRPEPGMHVCIGCGRNDTSHPSMICNQCADGSTSPVKWRPEPNTPSITAFMQRNHFSGNDSIVEDILDAATR